MRCPSCGTENAPDSRFCGGCGARLAASPQRVAPTQKISDDASYPQPQAAAPPGRAGHAATQPGAAPRLVPPPPAPYAPSSAAAARRPPHAPAPPAPPRPRTPKLDDPSLSMPMVARRPWGLILLVLLIDIGLGVAGVWMLNEGLDPNAPIAPVPDRLPRESR